MDLLISTLDSKPWDMKLNVYLHRNDLKQATGYDAIQEVIEKSLMDDLLGDMELNKSLDRGKTLILASSSDNPNQVYALLNDDKQLILECQSFAPVEAILVPKKDADYKFRQSILVEGMQIENGQSQIRVGLVSSKSQPTACWIEISSPNNSIDATRLLPGHISDSYHDCTTIQDYVKHLYQAKVI